MEYTVLKLAKLANVSARTLRYYDEIGLLRPLKINNVGYRIYGRQEVDKLQQILFYRELGVPLKEIKHTVYSPEFDRINALYEHLGKLIAKREQIDVLIKNIKNTIAAQEGRNIMNDKEKFEGFKQKMIDENEKAYGKEIRGKYSQTAIENSCRKLKNMTQEEYEAIKQLSEDIKKTLFAAYQTGNPASELAQQAVQMHKKWICFFWDDYSKEAHAALAQMYVDDERFRQYYNDIQDGMAVFLRDAITIYTK